ncbi:MAG: hypothetical protein DSY81_03305 [Bacillota bacterium]|nr:MAG: hypothetical protein DSY81_03305 [Bacillota bacterium]
MPLSTPPILRYDATLMAKPLQGSSRGGFVFGRTVPGACGAPRQGEYCGRSGDQEPRSDLIWPIQDTVRVSLMVQINRPRNAIGAWNPERPGPIMVDHVRRSREGLRPMLRAKELVLVALILVVYCISSSSLFAQC